MRAWLEHAVERFELVIVLDITPVTPDVDHHSPGFGESVRHYNQLILKAIPPSAQNVLHLSQSSGIERREFRLGRYLTKSDGHHLTKAGHALFGRIISAAARTRYKRSQLADGDRND